MAHFAEVASDGIVNRVVVVSDEDAGEDCSQAGVDWCDKNIPKTDPDCKWIQTSYNLNFRGRYAGPGYSWDEDDEIFGSGDEYGKIMDNKSPWFQRR